MHDIRGMVIGFVVLGAVGFVALKLTIPLEYRAATLRPHGLHYLAQVQRETSLSAVEAAQVYQYVGTDYEQGLPPRIQITTRALGDDGIRVEFYDPRPEDDSVWEKRTRIYLRQNAAGSWVPYHSEWSHKGRGRFGWTTKPTI